MNFLQSLITYWVVVLVLLFIVYVLCFFISSIFNNRTKITPDIPGLKPDGVRIEWMISMFPMVKITYNKYFLTGKEELKRVTVIPFKYFVAGYDPNVGVTRIYDGENHLNYQDKNIWSVSTDSSSSRFMISSEDPFVKERILKAEKIFSYARKKFASKIKKAQAQVKL